MPAAKTLEDHVRHDTFRARRHHGLLAGKVVPWPELAALQAEYAAATSEPERRAIGITFERAVRDVHVADVDLDAEVIAELERILALPAAPMSVCADPRAVERYFRAMRLAESADNGRPIAHVAAGVGLSPTSVRRELAWLDSFGLPEWLRPHPWRPRAASAV